jgi:hypothetical protein
MKVHEKVARSTAADFLCRLVTAVPFKIHKVLNLAGRCSERGGRDAAGWRADDGGWRADDGAGDRCQQRRNCRGGVKSDGYAIN